MPAAVERAVRRIYEESFPASERERFEDICQDIKQGRKTLTLISDAGTAIGFGTVTSLNFGGLYMLEYLAVDSKRRNQGVGERLLREILEHLSTDVGSKGLIFEVESPGVTSDAEQDLRKRRIDFYRRNGAILIDDHGGYRMPDLSGPGSQAMNLMWLPVRSGEVWNDEIGLEGLIHLIFKMIYGRETNDPLLINILKGLNPEN
jgi:GNAT superfamily N-acetyltransferase